MAKPNAKRIIDWYNADFFVTILVGNGRSFREGSVLRLSDLRSPRSLIVLAPASARTAHAIKSK